MTIDAKTLLVAFTRREAKNAGGIDTELGRALDLLADKFESLVASRNDADRLLDEALFSESTWGRIQGVRQQLMVDGRPRSEVEDDLRRHSILAVRERLALDGDRAAYDQSILKIRLDFQGASQP
jgi:hypothetical protein